MKYYTYRYTNKEGEEKELHLRLSSGDSIELESKVNKSVMAYIQEESMTMICTLLRYLRKWEDKNFSFNQAQQLYDELIDSGLTMKSILVDVIYEALVVSGFLDAKEWEEMKKLQANLDKQAKKILLQE